MSEISFRNRFIEAAKDQIIDKTELSELNELAKNPKLADKSLAKYVTADLNRFKDTTNLTYTINDPMGKTQQLKFTFTPAYSENELIPGKNMMEIISNITQGDTLNETTSDNSRCAAGSLLNAYLLMGGTFDSVAEKFGVEKQLTYKNVHLVQDKIYTMSNKDSNPGLTMGATYSYMHGSGKIVDPKYDGELGESSKKIGIDIKPIFGETIKTINDRSKTVAEFMKNNPNSVLQVGVYMDVSTGDLFSPTEQKASNHSVIIFKRDDKFYMADTGSLSNGTGKSLREITKEHFAGFVEYSTGTVHGLTMKK